MKHFLDTEFIESAAGIQLVSIGIVREDGKKFYAESCTFDERLADRWVKENVIAKLKFYGQPDEAINTCVEIDDKNGPGVITEVFGTEAYIKERLLDWFFGGSDPEFYAYFADYDWVLFCRIFGRMIDLPKNFPMFCMDLKQKMVHCGLSKEWKQKVCPDPEGEHNALVDAEWNMKLSNAIDEHCVLYTLDRKLLAKHEEFMKGLTQPTATGS
jgi:hypothetical protein